MATSAKNDMLTTRRDYLADHLRDVPAFRALLRGVECRLFEAAGELERPILDLGCGDGHFASMAFAEPLFTGIDPDEAMVREARDRGVYRWPLVADATRMPYADTSFATVVANCVVEHIPDIEAVMAETARVLKPGGRFLFGVPSHKFAEFLLGSTLLRALGVPSLAETYGAWFNTHSAHFTTDSPERWLARLCRHGFEVEHWEYYMSAAGHRAFDLAHYLGVPRLISRKLTGRWVAFQNPLTNALFVAWLRPYYEEGPPRVGAYIFFHARREGRGNK
ncbi:MAG: class I SAM-dependent methyltransferase [Ardenticatenaceae bacterium]|nr:class I SAM-dependent methyltransferase [Ardenticatenaceae bacterium]HBY95607.1 methyltransferase type 11 [Chloroflexota bacterium]